MVKKGTMGSTIAFIAIALALIVGILEATNIFDVSGMSGTITMILIIAGLIAGFYNIKKTESVAFMLSAIVIAGGAAILSILPIVGEGVQIVFGRLATLVIPAAIVVALSTAIKSIRR
jgi:peptidoglycan/LPS O-acetylase OafA/YrhL